jgi:hypothetical protein
MVPVGLGSKISRQSAHEGGKVVSLDTDLFKYNVLKII